MRLFIHQRSTISETIFTLTFLLLSILSNVDASGCASQQGNSSTQLFSSAFVQPPPPLVAAEFVAGYRQHKWNTNLSHIASGMIYNSPAAQKVRVDFSFTGTLGSSLFDFANVSADGLTANKYYSLSPSIASTPTCETFFVNSDFPLVPSDFLVASGAVFGGMRDGDGEGCVSEWDVLYQGAIPTTVLVNEANVVVGYDYFAPDERTRVVTRFFDIVVGPIDQDVFEFPDCGA